MFRDIYTWENEDGFPNGEQRANMFGGILPLLELKEGKTLKNFDWVFRLDVGLWCGCLQ